MDHVTTPFVADEERSLVRDACIGILAGNVAFGLLTLAIVRIAWSDQSWGFAAAIAVFTGLWAGVFFGSAAGVAYSQLQAARVTVSTPGDGASAPAVATSTPTPMPLRP
jgi:hypothetical protein